MKLLTAAQKEQKGSSIGEHFTSSGIHYVPGQSHIRMQHTHTRIYTHIHAQTHMCTHSHSGRNAERAAFLLPGDLPNPGVEPCVFTLQAAYSLIHLGSPMCKHIHVYLHT